jgi:hypothetical protein
MQAAPQFQQLPALPARIEAVEAAPRSARLASRTLLAVSGVGASVAALTWRAGPGLGWMVADVVLVVAVLAGIRRGRPGIAEGILGATSVWLAWMTCWRASDWALATALPGSVVALVALGLVAGRRIRLERIDEVGQATFDALRELPGGLVEAAKMPAVALSGQTRTRALQLLRGALVGLPLTGFFVLLLAADSAFAEAVERAVVRSGDGFELAVWTGAMTAGVLLGCVVLQRLQRRAAAASQVGGLGEPIPYRIEGDRSPARPLTPVQPPRLHVLTWSVVLLQLVGVFGVYVAANLRTSFAGHELLQSRGTWTYSQYVHQGFFQVAVAALFAVASVAVGHRLLRANGGMLPGGARLAAIELMLLALVGVTLASSVHRLTLYEEAYGYTELRLGVHLAQLGIAGLIALTSARCVLRSRKGWGAALGWSAVVFGVVVASTNADGWVAGRNVARARAGHPLDTAHLASLSEDAGMVLGDLRSVDAQAYEFLRATWRASAAADHGGDWRSWRGLGARF